MPLNKMQSVMVLLKPLFRQPGGMLLIEMYILIIYLIIYFVYFIEVDLQFLLIPRGLTDIVKRYLGDN